MHAHDGTVDWSFALDDSLVQYLAKDETVTATYTISVKDDFGDSATDTSIQTVTVTITGTNDRPVITAGDVGGHVIEDQNSSPINPGAQRSRAAAPSTWSTAVRSASPMSTPPMSRPQAWC